jgi:hypothetical protein
MRILKNKNLTLKNAWYYNQGNFRYWAYYNASWLLRKHICEQIAYRINSMNKECYDTGACIKCGCATIQLQMCDKPCEGLCYPRMASKFEWELMQNPKYQGVAWKVDNKLCRWRINRDKEKFERR